MDILVALLIVLGVLVFLWFKVPGFKLFIKKIGGPGDTKITNDQITKVKEKLVKEQEETARLKEWADLQEKINTERKNQAEYIKKARGGTK